MRRSAPDLPALPAAPLPDLAPDLALNTWLLPAVAARLRAGNGEFLTELRPAVALFLRFDGLDYEAADAGVQLDGFVRWVQVVLQRFAGVLLQLTIGEKGSYLYAAFGAPTIHEDDAERAVAAALALRTPPPELAISAVQMGVAQGTLRTGAYGGTT
ncbi:MAG: hypothetical protein H0T53_14665, partial [Herpetosiphonaceae bacterium]|nr:hypothetical protein [Herpetosiphonaceae bacterium]